MKQPTRLLLTFAFVLGTALLAGCVVDTNAGPIPFYETGCVDSTDCVSSAQCYTLTATVAGGGTSTDSFCSAACNFDSDCGSNGWCVQQYSATPICFEACASEFDCPGGWTCATLQDYGTSSSVTACVPNW